jgi:hypothetical protein
MIFLIAISFTIFMLVITRSKIRITIQDEPLHPLDRRMEAAPVVAGQAD